MRRDQLSGEFGCQLQPFSSYCHTITRLKATGIDRLRTAPLPSPSRVILSLGSLCSRPLWEAPWLVIESIASLGRQQFSQHRSQKSNQHIRDSDQSSSRSSSIQLPEKFGVIELIPIKNRFGVDDQVDDHQTHLVNPHHGILPSQGTRIPLPLDYRGIR